MATTPKFDRCIDFVLDHEGYWSEDPNDPGGLTIWGLCMRYEKEQVIAMKSMSQDEAKACARQYYFDTYWTDVGAENYADDIALVVFDGAVNQGVNIMKAWLNGLGNQVTADKIVCWRMCRYIERIGLNPNLKVFTLGWMNRLTDLYRRLKDVGGYSS